MKKGFVKQGCVTLRTFQVRHGLVMSECPRFQKGKSRGHSVVNDQGSVIGYRPFWGRNTVRNKSSKTMRCRSVTEANKGKSQQAATNPEFRARLNDDSFSVRGVLPGPYE